MRKALSEEAIKAAVCPPGKNKDHVWDTVQPGLALRVYATGRKAYFAYYRVGSGRKAPQRWDLIGVAGKIALKDARSASRAITCS